MNEQLNKIRAIVHELEEQLETIRSLDDQTTDLLEEAIRDIQEKLRSEEPSSLAHPSLIQRLRGAAERFETSHPTLTAIVGRMTDALGQMGV